MVREAAEDTVLEIPNKPHGQEWYYHDSSLRLGKGVQVSRLFIKKNFFQCLLQVIVDNDWRSRTFFFLSYQSFYWRTVLELELTLK